MPPTGSPTRPHVQIDRAGVIFWLQLASLLATGWVVWRIAILPFGVRLLPGTILLAAWYSMAALALSAAITFLLLLAVRKIERAETVNVTLRTCAAGVWFAPAAILLGSSSPLATAAALVLVVSVTRVLYSQWRAIPRRQTAEPLPPGEGLLFGPGELPTGFAPRDFWPALTVAASLQMGWASSSIGRESAAAAFYALAAAVLTAYGISAGVWNRERQPVLPRAIMGVAVTLLLAVLITLLGTIMPMGGGSESDSAGGGTASKASAKDPKPPPPPPPPALPARKYDPPPIDPARLGPPMTVPGGFPGVILWPETAPVPMLVEPMPAGDGLSRRPPSRPFVIPFDGAYWMFRWPFTRPPSNSFVRRGTPSEMSFSTVDRWPLSMEAHQKLQREIDLKCCSKVQIAILNADKFPGTVAIELGLVHHGGPPFRMGTARVNSMPDLRNDPVVPVSETLEFTVPQNVPRCDEFDVVYDRLKLREDKSARIAIQKFVLVPR